MIGRRFYRSVWLLLGLCLAASGALAEQTCQHLTATGNPEYPPYLWRDPENPQRLIGVNADLLKQVGESLGLDVQVVYAGPWSRAQEEVRTGHIDLLAGYFLTQAREQAMDFISPPFLYTPSVVWVRQDGAFDYGKWSDLKGHKGGTLVNNSHGQAFDDYARANLDLEAVPSARQAFEKLLLKRSDYVVYEQFPGMALAGQLNMDEQLKVLAPAVSSEGLYLAFSQASPCNQPQLRERLAQKMKQMVSGQLPQRLLEQNLQRWKQQQSATQAP